MACDIRLFQRAPLLRSMATFGAMAPLPTSTLTGVLVRWSATLGAMAPFPTSTFTGVFVRWSATLGAMAPFPTSTLTGVFVRWSATFGAIAPFPTSTRTLLEPTRRTILTLRATAATNAFIADPCMSEGLAQDGTPLPNLESPVLQCNAGIPPVQGIFHWHNAAGSRRVRGKPENVDP